MPAKLTLEIFIERSKLVHGDFYDYSKSIYTYSHKPLIIIDPEYGEFSQIPNLHMNGAGHPKRSYKGRKKKPAKTLEQFVKEANVVHGEGNYEYSNSVYVNSSTKIKIYDPLHGKFFEQLPSSHLQGVGSPYRAGNIKRTRDEFIKLSQEIHGDKFDYSLTEYKNNISKVILILKETGQVFEQIVSDHLSGKAPRLYITTEIFIERSKAVHGDRYSYHESEYVNNSTDVKIYDNELNEFFYQRPSVHWRGGENPSRKVEKIRQKQLHTIEQFIERANIVHNYLYDYSESVYDGALKKLVIIDPVYGRFEQTAASHLTGCGHPSRAVGFNPHIPTRLYTLVDKFDDALKTGFTQQGNDCSTRLKQINDSFYKEYGFSSMWKEMLCIFFNNENGGHLAKNLEYIVHDKVGCGVLHNNEGFYQVGDGCTETYCISFRNKVVGIIKDYLAEHEGEYIIERDVFGLLGEVIA